MSKAVTRPSRVVSYTTECMVEDQAEAIYTCPANCRALVHLLFISNPNGNTSLTVRWDRSDPTHDDVYIIGGKNMTTGEYIKFDGSYIVLEPGDTVTVTPTGNATPRIDVICTVEEIFLPLISA